MPTTISGDLHGVDYSDRFELTRSAKKYTYELSASDGGKVSFKVEALTPALLGELGGASTWGTIEEKSKISSGTTLKGEFTVPQTVLSSTVTSDSAAIRLTFSRAALSAGVDYKLYFTP